MQIDTFWVSIQLQNNKEKKKEEFPKKIYRE